MTVKIMIGDVREQLALIPENSIDCCVTSPPYWGLRDYEVDGQIGMEPTLGEHLAVLVDVFEAVKRVLKPEGTLWLNYGDCYATKPNGRSAVDTKAAGNDDRTFRDKPFSTVGPIYGHLDKEYEKTARAGKTQNLGQLGAQSGPCVVGVGMLKPKDLCMIPNRLAIALQDAGWWVRSEIIWGKPNPMPDSSGRYRPSTAHEKIWLLTKSARSFYDSMAVRMPASDASIGRWAQDVESQAGSDRANGGSKTNGPMRAVGGRPQRARAEEIAEAAGLTDAHFEAIKSCGIADTGKALVTTNGAGRNSAENLRLAAEAKEALGGYYREFLYDSSTRLLRNYEPDLSAIIPPEVWPIATAAFKDAHFATFPPSLVAPCLLASCPVGGTVLDPFGGAGTTGLVADRMQRDAILIELNPEYAAIAQRRLDGDRGGLLDAMEAA